MPPTQATQKLQGTDSILLTENSAAVHNSSNNLMNILEVFRTLTFNNLHVTIYYYIIFYYITLLLD